MMIEVCAGMLDQDNAEQCVIRETEEETGYRLTTVHKIMETYMSPGRN
jgi:8-oxo-dGTP pyrophosphatase MutT (NUDIX family)